MTLSDDYADFGAIGAAVLRMLGQIKVVEVADEDVQDLKSAMSHMPPHADVRESLHRLEQAGFRMVTLTNNAAATASAQLAHSGIAGFFERTFSVDDEVRRYKPARACYEGVARVLYVAPPQCLLIACHTWDTIGASSAGMQSALVMRTGNASLGVGRQPDFAGVQPHHRSRLATEPALNRTLSFFIA